MVYEYDLGGDVLLGVPMNTTETSVLIQCYETGEFLRIPEHHIAEVYERPDLTDASYSPDKTFRILP